MRTKQEVIQFLESKVGTTVPCKGNPSLDGQCVTLMKAILEFLGAPDPYKARGHAKTVISAYLSEGIADPGIGFLSVFSNKNMGDGYGHIWCNVGDGDGVYYESNGQKPLTVTKGKTYSYDTVCNFDSYIKSEGNMTYEQLGKKFTENLEKHKNSLEYGPDKHKLNLILHDEDMINRIFSEMVRDRQQLIKDKDSSRAEGYKEGFKKGQESVPTQPITPPTTAPTIPGYEVNGLEISLAPNGETIYTWNYKKLA